VSEDSIGERLGDKRHVTLVLRLVVDIAGTLMHGEIGDLNGRTRGRFAAWDKLAGSVQAVILEHDR
jgi:hypothetical protein